MNPATSSFHNTAFGSGALQAVTTGNGNTAIGSGALPSNIQAWKIQQSVLMPSILTIQDTLILVMVPVRFFQFNRTQKHHLGASALRNNQGGSNNTVVGSEAGYNAYGSNNVFIGYNAGYNELNGSNKLYIENSDADSTQALIFGNFATNDLRINGKTLAKMTPLMMTPAVFGIVNNNDFMALG